jgi:NAD(P)-dependent dehydrogenase (short-subunit alcohol dehydrogenase family)
MSSSPAAIWTAAGTSLHRSARGTGRRVLPYACHIGHWAEIDGLVDFAPQSFGRVDVLVNNAGISPPYPSLLEGGRGPFF